MNCYISMHSPNTAKRHVDELMRRMGFTDWAVGTGRGKVATFFRKLFSMVNLLLKLKRGDVLVIQYPFKKFFVIQCNIARLKGAKTVTLIHDLGTFRRRKLTAEKEVKRLSHTDVIIVHNQCMNDWLTEHGCRVPLVNLDIFDYLSTEEPLTLNPQLSTLNPQPSTLNSQLSTVNSSLPPGGVGGGSHLPTIAFAGGISQRKTGFLYQVDGVLDGCHFDLYGAGLIPGTEREWRNTTYHGQIDSDEFIRTTTPSTAVRALGAVTSASTIPTRLLFACGLDCLSSCGRSLPWLLSSPARGWASPSIHCVNCLNACATSPKRNMMATSGLPWQ